MIHNIINITIYTNNSNNNNKKLYQVNKHNMVEANKQTIQSLVFHFISFVLIYTHVHVKW